VGVMWANHLAVTHTFPSSGHACRGFYVLWRSRFQGTKTLPVCCRSREAEKLENCESKRREKHHSVMACQR
jgi:hypothetical protein